MIGLDNLGSSACLVLEDIERLQRALRAGTPATAVARAFGINVRTVYRYARAELYTATVAGHELAFIVYRPGEKPTLIERKGERKVGQRRGGEHARTNG